MNNYSFTFIKMISAIFLSLLAIVNATDINQNEVSFSSSNQLLIFELKNGSKMLLWDAPSDDLKPIIGYKLYYLKDDCEQWSFLTQTEQPHYVLSDIDEDQHSHGRYSFKMSVVYQSEFFSKQSEFIDFNKKAQLCGNAPVSNNSLVTPVNGSIGDLVIYKCKPGYLMEGHEFNMCDFNKTSQKTYWING